MCLQCTVDAVVVKQDFLGPYSLMRATNDKSLKWPKDTLGLVEFDDPTFVITAKVLQSPDCFEDDESEDVSATEGGIDDMLQYSASILRLQEDLKCSPYAGWELMELASNAGCDFKVISDSNEANVRFLDWFMERLHGACNS